MRYFPFRAMNTDLLLVAEGDEARVQSGFIQTQKFIEACERRFTRFSETSELAALNRASGGWFKASPTLFDVIRQAQRYVELSGGLFNPLILPTLKAIGYDRSMDEIRANGAPLPEQTQPFTIADFSTVRLEAASHSIWLPPDAQIDLGGIAKGWIAEQAARLLSKYATACAVDAGGDIFAIGLPEGENCWQIGLEDPREVTRNLAVLKVGPGAVATSSVVKRVWKQGQQARHHLIDPRTGLPAETDWLCVTVVADSGAAAEVFAKSLLIAGPDGAEEIQQQAGGIRFIAVDPEGILWGNAGDLL